MGIEMKKMKHKPSIMYDAIKVKVNISDLYLISQGPDKFIIVPIKAKE